MTKPKADTRRLFYSWQSDSDERINKILQRDVLKAALKEMGRDDPDLAMRVESDTTGVAGTPEITKTIFDRIGASICMAADISIINPDYNGRKTPNPNVLLELGFASKVLGWERIITFINLHFGGFEDLPFDLRGRRPTIPYRLHPGETDEVLEKIKINLIGNLKSHLKMTIASNPTEIKSLKAVKDGRIKRKRDIDTLKRMLSQVSTSAIEQHCTMFSQSESFSEEIMYFANILDAYESSSRIHFYDNNLKNLITKLSGNVDATLSFPQHFKTDDGQIYHFMYGDWYKNDEDHKAAKRLHELMNELKQNLGIFNRYINENYLEIDLFKLNRIALKNYQREIVA